MAALLPQPFEFRHSWKHLTVQHKASDDYILWIALDHLYGNGKIYVKKALFKEREFEQAFRTSYQGILTRKSVGGKGKSKDSTETKMTPEGLLRAVGLVGDGKGSYLNGGYLSIKATSPFLFEIRAIESHEFSEKYQEHLNRIAERILRPTVTISEIRLAAPHLHGDGNGLTEAKHHAKYRVGSWKYDFYNFEGQCQNRLQRRSPSPKDSSQKDSSSKDTSQKDSSPKDSSSKATLPKAMVYYY